jgi:hypothetical protein
MEVSPSPTLIFREISSDVRHAFTNLTPYTVKQLFMVTVPRRFLGSLQEFLVNFAPACVLN